MSRMIDETGNKYGLLTVIDRAPSKNKKTYWRCICDCGREHIVNASNLRTGAVKSCGQCIYNNKKQDLTGQQFGVLKVLKEAPSQNGKIMWKCECIYCNRKTIVSGTNLKTGHTKSCTCITGSTGEYIIKTILEENNIDFVEQYMIDSFKLSTGGIPKFDFAIFNKEKKLLCFIEFDGEQHYITTGGWNDESCHNLTIQRDIEKNQYCQKHNIPLVRIPYYELNQVNILYILQKIDKAIREE